MCGVDEQVRGGKHAQINTAGTAVHAACACAAPRCVKSHETATRAPRAGALRRLSRSASRVLAVGVILFDEELRHVEDKR